MDFTPDALLARAAHDLSPRAGELACQVEEALRRDVPELWEDPEVRASQNIAERVAGALFALEYNIPPGDIEPPAADLERARRLARHGTPVSVLLRAYRLGQGVVVDRILEQMPRLTDDPRLICATTQRLIARTTQFLDRTSERGVAAYQEEWDRRLRGRMATVNEASTRIGTTLDIARTAQELADLAAENFADLVTVDLLDSVLPGPGKREPGVFTLRRVAHRTGEGESPVVTTDVAEVHTCAPGSPEQSALVTGLASRYDADTSTSDPGLSGGVAQIHSILVAPLCTRGTTLGVARFYRLRATEPFDDADLLFVQDIVARAATAIDNALRYTRMRANALALQRSFLPRHTTGQNTLEIAYRYLPAAAELGVGGDWYDIIPLSGARVALVVGDVVGHGIHAAATMGRLRTAVRTLADIDLPPDELLTHLDDVVIRLSAEAVADADTQDEGDLGATCLYAVYDPVSRRCNLARAGHVLPVMVTSDGVVDMVDLPPGPPLGLGGLPFESAEIDLPDGSLLALYTDGLVEARDHDIETGITRLRGALARPSDSLEDACDFVVKTLLPDQPEDDVALVLARAVGLADRHVATWELEADPAIVSRTRSAVSRQLADWGLEGLDFTAELVVSELVTNAIRYGRPPIRLRLIHDHALMCEVTDDSSTTPHLRRARVFDEGGRGLLLVGQLARHWGTRHARHGKTVWAELDDSAGLVTLDLDLDLELDPV
ncbi:SpoIIE family protein phosphatase [Streptomyces sp. SID13726]|uniref:ATP-binding SpoIIE family protein phosphatase n=1 Tax=Streptomyces sp. SID13726 TaxID=2706058 RepID=UPI0031BADE37